jgi:16S rRNA (guanine966-N2)-methyltransferase
VREALFSILGDVEGAEVLDLFAGTGALGIEAISRGAKRVTFVEQGRGALRALRQNLRQLDLELRVHVIATPVERVLKAPPWPAETFDLVLVDPPYSAIRDHASVELTHILETGLPSSVRRGGRVVLEHGGSDIAPPLLGLQFESTRTYGDTALSFYVR